MKPMKLLVFFAMIGTSVSLGFGASIQTPAYDFSSISLASDTPLTLGFWFKTNQAVVISDLGYFDDGGDGFGMAHDVGLFDPGGALLAFTKLSAGTTDPIDGHFRYRSISPIELTPDTWYVLAATTGGPTDEWGYGHADNITGLNISLLISVPSDAAAFVYQAGDTLQFPTERFGYQFYAGPNMLLADAANVPEPGSIALVLAGALMLGFSAFRNRKKPGSSITRIIAG